MKIHEDPLIVALDLSTLRQAREWVNRLYPLVKQFKIGSQLFTAAGPKAVEMVHKKRAKVFLDLKWHDIPNTVANAARAAAQMGVWMCSVHASGGRAMLVAAREALEEESRRLKVTRPLLIAVTVLTSLDEKDLKALGVRHSVKTQVLALAALAQSCRLDGVVASPQEIRGIRRQCGPKMILVTPGIAFSQDSKAQWDQKRKLSPAEALKEGANFIVMGRSVLESEDPLGLIQSVRRIRMIE